MSTTIPAGFRMTGVCCGIKSEPGREDLTLVVSDGPATAAGVYTQNIVHAAPVARDRRLTPRGDARAVVANSGNANACTGRQGLQDADRMGQLAAAAIGAEPDQVLVLSTGIIGQPLPMDKIESGIRTAAQQLGDTQSHLEAAARGILTTDQWPKTAARQTAIDGRSIRLLGLAKGAGMIGPHMATMLAIVLTDAPLTPGDAQQVLQQAVDVSFNCISVDGHMSTNDTVLLLASGRAGGPPLAGDDLKQLAGAIGELCIELAQMIPRDGEGASHLIEISVRGCRTRDDAHRIAKSIANSPLVKTAVAGADPNWGRIVSAAGYAGVAFNPDRLIVRLNGTVLFQNGEPAPFDAAAVSLSIRQSPLTRIEVQLAEGSDECRFWTSDLTVDYVRLNSEYHT